MKVFFILLSTAQEPEHERTVACANVVERLAQRMPEDWGADEKLRIDCGMASQDICAHTPSGLARLNSCMR